MTPHSRMSAAPAPLWAVLAFTFSNSIGNAIMYSGVFALAERLYGFDDWRKFGLAIVWGLAYVPGALAAGPIVRYAGRKATTLSPRGVLLMLMVVMGLTTLLPVLASTRIGVLPTGSWVIWLSVGVYGLLSGIHWPIVESYISGGRGGHDLQAATGKFNIAWSSSMVVGMLAMAPFLKEEPHTLGILAAMSVIHLGGLVLAWTVFPAYPGKHGPTSEHAGQPVPQVYKDLLVVFRLLLPAAFIVSSALSPYLPAAVDALGLSLGWKTGIFAVWMSTRVLTFVLLERRRGWHGSWAMPVIGGIILLAGFAAAVLAPTLGATTAARALMIAGLGVFGVGIGTIYTGALYYAMEAGSAEVDAGGKHEAIIGAGYTIGPVCSVAGLIAADNNLMRDQPYEVGMLVLASAAALTLAGAAAHQVLGKTKGERKKRKSSAGASG